MRLNVAKIQLRMFRVIELCTSNDSPRAKHSRNAVGGWEAVQPECSIIDHFDDHTSRNALERESVVNSPNLFLESTDVKLHLRDMLIIGSRIRSDSHIGQITAQRFKLAIHE
jgi:hypothetical protein